MEIDEVVVNDIVSNGIGVVSCGNGLENICNENGSVEADASEEGVSCGNGLENICNENGSVEADASEEGISCGNGLENICNENGSVEADASEEGVSCGNGLENICNENGSVEADASEEGVSCGNGLENICNENGSVEADASEEGISCGNGLENICNENGSVEADASEEGVSCGNGLVNICNENGSVEADASEEGISCGNGLENICNENGSVEADASEEGVSCGNGLENICNENGSVEADASEEGVSCGNGLENICNENGSVEADASEEGISCGNGLENICNENGSVEADASEEGVSCGNGLEKACNENGSLQADVSEKVEENVAEVLEDWEEYWDDINDRLMILRMVSDSVIKGLVTDVEQEASERIAAKELELASLKKCLRACTCKFENEGLPVVQKVYERGEYGKCSCSMEACEKNKKMREDLNALRNSVREQFKKFKEEVEVVRGSNSMKKIGSGSELVGLGETLHEKQSENWMPAKKMLDNLETTLDTFCRKVDDILLSSSVPICESQQDLDLLTTLEDVVKKTAIGSLPEEFQENLLEQSTQFCGIQNMNWLEKFNNISGLGTKLDAILKSLSVHETELASHGSHDLDQLLQKVNGIHGTPPIAHYGENGAVDASNIHVAESYNFDQLKHMSKEELVNYFNLIITKMKRDHESTLHLRTEEYFCLIREYLKLKRSFTTDRKDEEFDVLMKKIPEVISKLEDFLLENERFPALTKNLETLGELESRIDSLLSENRDLRDCWTNEENEVKRLRAEVSDAASELLQRSLAEENLLKLVGNLESKVEDSHIEASLSEEVYICALKEQIAQIRPHSDDSNMMFVMAQETYDNTLREAAIPAESANIYGIDDSEVESLIVQELDALIMAKAVRDSRRQLDDLCQKILEKENELKLEAAEKEKLKQEILDLRTVMEQKEKLVIDSSVTLQKEREQFELAYRELTSLREHANQLLALVIKSNKDIESLRSRYLGALDQIELEKMEKHNLSQKLDQTRVVLAEANKERDKAFVVSQEMHDTLLSSKAREQKLKKEMEMAANGFSKIISDFECRVSGSIKINGLRLKDTTSDLKALTEMANEVRRTGLMYKNKLDKRCIDLQMAESEVDLLGDKVDALIRLLEKIYIALDHYSPILKHYPGIMDILELVRRELTGKSTLRP